MCFELFCFRPEPALDMFKKERHMECAFTERQMSRYEPRICHLYLPFVFCLFLNFYHPDFNPTINTAVFHHVQKTSKDFFKPYIFFQNYFILLNSQIYFLIYRLNINYADKPHHLISIWFSELVNLKIKN